MVARSSVIGVLTQNIDLIRSNRLDLDRLNLSLATGEKFRALKFYGTDAPRVVDFQKDIEARESYLRSIDITESTVQSYDAILEQLVNVTADALKAAEPLSTQDENFETNTTVLANNFMLEVEANMNIKLGDRFIFAGTNFTSAPMVDLRSLSLYTTNDLTSAGAPDNVIETGDQIPEHIIDQGGANTIESYHTSFAATGTINSAAYDDLRVTINDGQPITYNINATESAFQNLVEGLLRLKSAAQTGLTEVQRDEFLGDARNVLETARNELRQLQSTNGTVLNELRRTSDIHKGFITISQNALGEITVADEADVAVRIAALQNQLQASFTVISAQSQLSLVNFLR